MVPKSTPPDIHSEAFLRSLMRRQLRLSLLCASAFVIALLGLPLFNYFVPDLTSTRVAGFPLTWMVLGIIFFPFVWFISWFFINRSIRLEKKEVAEVKNGGQP
jgi:uncharacterized membrane protein (DUF485 family)